MTGESPRTSLLAGTTEAEYRHPSIFGLPSHLADLPYLGGYLPKESDLTASIRSPARLASATSLPRQTYYQTGSFDHDRVAFKAPPQPGAMHGPLDIPAILSPDSALDRSRSSASDQASSGINDSGSSFSLISSDNSSSRGFASPPPHQSYHHEGLRPGSAAALREGYVPVSSPDFHRFGSPAVWSTTDSYGASRERQHSGARSPQGLFAEKDSALESSMMARFIEADQNRPSSRSPMGPAHPAFTQYHDSGYGPARPQSQNQFGNPPVWLDPRVVNGHADPGNFNSPAELAQMYANRTSAGGLATLDHASSIPQALSTLPSGRSAPHGKPLTGAAAAAAGQEFSVFVGDLSPDLKEEDLVIQFLQPPPWPPSHPHAIAHAHALKLVGHSPAQGRARPAPFLSTKSAKIMTDSTTGASRGFGFVRFTQEADCLRALVEMQGVVITPSSGLSPGRPLRVCTATPKNRVTVGGDPVPGNPATLGLTPADSAAAISVNPASRAGLAVGGSGTVPVRASSPPSVFNARQPSFVPFAYAREPFTETGSGTSPFAGQSHQSSLSPSGSNASLSAQAMPQNVAQFVAASATAPAANPAAALTHDGHASSTSSQSTGPINGAPSSSATDPSNTTVFVGGLSSLISEDTLKTFFVPFGDITYVKIPPGKGCGFVQFVRKADAERAIERMQGFPIGGGRIRLSWGRSQGDKAAAAAAQAAAQAAQLGHLAGLAGLSSLSPSQLAQLAGLTSALSAVHSQTQRTDPANAPNDPVSAFARQLVATNPAFCQAATNPPAAYPKTGDAPASLQADVEARNGHAHPHQLESALPGFSGPTSLGVHMRNGSDLFHYPGFSALGAQQVSELADHFSGLKFEAGADHQRAQKPEANFHGADSIGRSASTYPHLPGLSQAYPSPNAAPQIPSPYSLIKSTFSPFSPTDSPVFGGHAQLAGEEDERKDRRPGLTEEHQQQHLRGFDSHNSMRNALAEHHLKQQMQLHQVQREKAIEAAGRRKDSQEDLGPTPDGTPRSGAPDAHALTESGPGASDRTPTSTGARLSEC